MATNIHFEDWLAVTQLYADYASAVDSGNWDLWPEFFIDDCVYRLQPRENHERGFPLATLAVHQQRHAEGPHLRHQGDAVPRPVLPAPRGRRAGACARPTAGRFDCEANYAVFRTKLSEAIDGVQRRPLHRHGGAHAARASSSRRANASTTAK